MSMNHAATTAAAPSGAPERHVRSLDGVRAIAIIGVLLTHAGAPLFEAGWLGVDLFFALSGFLITTLLLEEHARVGAISYKDFLARRALRLMPAYLLYVAVMTYGIFLQNVIDFLIIAFVIFLMVRQINRMRSALPPVKA